MTERPEPNRDRANANGAASAGYFIAFEGGEGAGKTTHSKLLLQQLEQAGCPARLVREPGGTALGEYLRHYLKSDRNLTPEAELMLFAAARAELCYSVIQPALSQGQIVIADRYAASTAAYQGAGRGLNAATIRQVNHFATGGRFPDLNILLDLPPHLGLRRSAQQSSFAIDLQEKAVPLARNRTGRRFDDLPLPVHNAIRTAFLGLARSAPARWTVLDATADLDSVADQVWQIAAQKLNLNPAAAPTAAAALIA